MKIRNHMFGPTALTLTALATATAFILGATPASATIICDSPSLPPGCGEYLTPAAVHILFEDPDLDPDVKRAILSDVSHGHFFNPVIEDIGGGDELESFDSTLTGRVEVTLADGTIIPNQPFVLTGPVQVISQGKAGVTTGSWDTEIVSMSLSGIVLGKNILIQQDPNKPSLGQTTITPIGGDFQIDSFFDIFVTVSIDGGPSIPQTGGAARINLVPEPTTLVLATVGLLGLAGFGSRRRRR